MGARGDTLWLNTLLAKSAISVGTDHCYVVPEDCRARLEFQRDSGRDPRWNDAHDGRADADGRLIGYWAGIPVLVDGAATIPELKTNATAGI